MENTKGGFKMEEHNKGLEEKNEGILNELHAYDEPVKAVKGKRKFDFWKLLSIVLIVLLIASIVVNFDWYSIKGDLSNSLSKDEAASKALGLINQNFLQGQAVATLTNVEDNGDLYKMKLSVSGQEMEGYITKDGKLFFPQAIELSQAPSAAEQQGTQQQENVIKSDKPSVEVFIMSHCPYGTQIEKGILPVAYLLKDKIDFEVKFVSYAMHGETEVKEELNQYCIQKEQNDKFLDYLKCFLEDGNRERCLAEVKIDTDALETCTTAADKEFSVMANLEDQSSWLSGQFPLFNVNKADNEKYNVRGSPTLVINEVTASAGRDSVSLLGAICDAFNEAPEECSAQLEADTPSPGFGWSGAGSNNVASCGG